MEMRRLQPRYKPFAVATTRREYQPAAVFAMDELSVDVMSMAFEVGHPEVPPFGYLRRGFRMARVGGVG